MADRLTQALSGKTCGFEDEAAGTRAFLADAEDLARRCADSIRDDPIRLAGGRARRAVDADSDVVGVDSVGEASGKMSEEVVAAAASDL